MQTEIRRSIISGSASAPPSAPFAHRALLLAALSPGQTQVSGLPPIPAIQATISACRALGADIVQSGSIADVMAPEALAAPSEVHCADSNTTLKLMLPVCASLGSEANVSVSGKLSEADLSPFLEFLKEAGAQVAQSVSFPARVRGPILLQERLYSAGLGPQFLSGIILCSPLLPEGASIGIEGRMLGWQYVKDAMIMMKEYGIEFYSDGQDFISLPGGQAYLPPEEIRVPASPYLSSFLLLAGALCGKATLRGSCDWQAHEQLFGAFGASVSIRKHEISVSAGALSGIELEASEAGLFLPHAIVLACVSEGESRIDGVTLLPRRAQSRASKLCRELGKMGAKITEEKGGISITGGRLSGAAVSPDGDPAVAMALAAAAVFAQGKTTIDGSECIERTYPGFFRDLSMLGAIVRQ
jgi:3-phosphoshikimate 1-carboxyvinyltransferase